MITIGIKQISRKELPSFSKNLKSLFPSSIIVAPNNPDNYDLSPSLYFKCMVDGKEVEIITSKNREYPDNKILNLLGKFKNSDKIELALSIIIEYIKKDNSIIPEAYKLFAYTWGYGDEIYYSDFHVQKKVIERLISFWMATILGLIILPHYGASALDKISLSSDSKELSEGSDEEE